MPKYDVALHKIEQICDAKELEKACQSGDITQFEELIYTDAMLSGKNAEGLTCLHIAASAGYPMMVTHLLEIGADPYGQDDSGKLPITLAVENNQIDTVRVLLMNERRCSSKDLLFKDRESTKHNNPKLQPLYRAVELGNQGLVELLCEDPFFSNALIKGVSFREEYECIKTDFEHIVRLKKGAHNDIQFDDTGLANPFLKIMIERSHRHLIKFSVDIGLNLLETRLTSCRRALDLCPGMLGKTDFYGEDQCIGSIIAKLNLQSHLMSPGGALLFSITCPTSDYQVANMLLNLGMIIEPCLYEVTVSVPYAKFMGLFTSFMQAKYKTSLKQETHSLVSISPLMAALRHNRGEHLPLLLSKGATFDDLTLQALVSAPQDIIISVLPFLNLPRIKDSSPIKLDRLVIYVSIFESALSLQQDAPLSDIDNKMMHAKIGQVSLADFDINDRILFIVLFKFAILNDRADMIQYCIGKYGIQRFSTDDMLYFSYLNLTEFLDNTSAHSDHDKESLRSGAAGITLFDMAAKLITYSRSGEDLEIPRCRGTWQNTWSWIGGDAKKTSVPASLLHFIYKRNALGCLPYMREFFDSPQIQHEVDVLRRQREMEVRGIVLRQDDLTAVASFCREHSIKDLSFDQMSGVFYETKNAELIKYLLDNCAQLTEEKVVSWFKFIETFTEGQNISPILDVKIGGSNVYTWVTLNYTHAEATRKLCSYSNITESGRLVQQIRQHCYEDHLSQRGVFGRFGLWANETIGNPAWGSADRRVGSDAEVMERVRDFYGAHKGEIMLFGTDLPPELIPAHG